jgi:hypothetical protein
MAEFPIKASYTAEGARLENLQKAIDDLGGGLAPGK